MPKKYSPKHFVLLISLSAEAWAMAFLLHAAFYALFWHFVCGVLWNKVCAGDEPVFFIIALFVVPTGFALGLVGRIWQWAVVKPIEEMKANGIQLPDKWRYFVPIISWVWLWKFSKGINSITERRILTSGVFCVVFFLGIVGLFIIRGVIQRRLARVAA